ncbi:glycoside hydrolase family 78 protein [Paractinoplanes deccanensis]
MTPYGLTTEQMTEPLGLGEPRPRLSWRLRSGRHAAAQTAYRITATVDGSDRLVRDSVRRELLLRPTRAARSPGPAPSRKRRAAGSPAAGRSTATGSP